MMMGQKLFSFLVMIGLGLLGQKAFSSTCGTSHFLSLRSSQVNLRVGPGTEYPVEWIFVRAHMPVEIISEFGVWRKIRDFEGTEGWVHQSNLSRSRAVMIVNGNQILRKKKDETSNAVVQVNSGVIATLSKCEDSWCRIKVKGYEGWVKMQYLWGVSQDSEGMEKEKGSS
jgi:SH3-like domain-containing protein